MNRDQFNRIKGWTTVTLAASIFEYESEVLMQLLLSFGVHNWYIDHAGFQDDLISKNVKFRHAKDAVMVKLAFGGRGEPHSTYPAYLAAVRLAR